MSKIPLVYFDSTGQDVSALDIYPVLRLFSFSRRMGVDIRHNKDRKVHRTEPKSQDIYLRLLVKLYRFAISFFVSFLNPRMLYVSYIVTGYLPPCYILVIGFSICLKCGETIKSKPFDYLVTFYSFISCIDNESVRLQRFFSLSI